MKEIKSLTQNENGVASIKGVVTFVKNVNVDWKGNVKVIKVGPTYVVAEPTTTGESKDSNQSDF